MLGIAQHDAPRLERRPLSAQLAAGAMIDEPVAVIVAHPDDETLGLGARLHKLRDWQLIHLSDGAPRDMHDALRAGFSQRSAYAQARRQELQNALTVLGAQPRSMRVYGCADREVSEHLLALIQQLDADLGAFSAVVTHAYEYGHPDHDATAFCVHAACVLRRRRCAHVPQLVEFAGYHLRAGQAVFGQFWRDPLRDESSANLDASEVARKSRALACFHTQQDFIARFPRARERYRLAPAYDFTRPAPPGQAFYDALGWNVDSAKWAARVHAALQEFELRGKF